MKNLRKLGVSILLVCITLSVFAQEGKEHNKEASKEKMNALKIGYLTEKLSLTESEATVFWPLYNEEKAAVKALMPKKENKGEKVKLEDQSASEIEKHIYEKFDIQAKKLDIQKSYATKYINAIGAEKVARLYKAEHDFKKEMLQKLKKGGGENKEHHDKK